MKHPIRMLVFGLAAVCRKYASVYSGELWLSQAINDSAHHQICSRMDFWQVSFIVGITEKNYALDLCFNASPDQMQLKPYGDRKRLYQRPKPRSQGSCPRRYSSSNNEPLSMPG